MITEWQMYWLTRLDGLHDASSSLAFTLILVGLFATLGYPVFSDIFDGDERKKSRMLRLTSRFQIAMFAIGIFAWLTHLMVPTMKEMAVIKVVPMIANSQNLEKLGEVGNNMLDLANEWLQESRPSRHVPAKAEN